MRSRFDLFLVHVCRGLSTLGPGCAVVGLILLTGHPVTAATRATAQEEQILQQLWQRHQSVTTEHARFAETCARLEARYPDYVFLPIVRGVAAWHHLQDGSIDESVNLWLRIKRDASRDPIGRAAQRMSRTWLTRIDREQVRKALRKAYTEKVRYPETLAPLRAMDAATRPPLEDRWGDPWLYEWASFRFLNVRQGQHYRLESTNIRTTSDITKALKIDYGEGLTLRPERLIDSTGDRQTLEFKTITTPAESVTLTEGASYRGQSFVYIGVRIVILADGDHWEILSRPSP